MVLLAKREILILEVSIPNVFGKAAKRHRVATPYTQQAIKCEWSLNPRANLTKKSQNWKDFRDFIPMYMQGKHKTYFSAAHHSKEDDASSTRYGTVNKLASFSESPM